MSCVGFNNMVSFGNILSIFLLEIGKDQRSGLNTSSFIIPYRSLVKGIIGRNVESEEGIWGEASNGIRGN